LKPNRTRTDLPQIECAKAPAHVDDVLLHVIIRRGDEKELDVARERTHFLAGLERTILPPMARIGPVMPMSANPRTTLSQ
jgi:hypothetical protein